MGKASKDEVLNDLSQKNDPYHEMDKVADKVLNGNKPSREIAKASDGDIMNSL